MSNIMLYVMTKLTIIVEAMHKNVYIFYNYALFIKIIKKYRNSNKLSGPKFSFN